MAEREMTCIVCPQGCRLRVEYEGRNILSVSGYTCKRGEKYAVKEMTSPERTVTGTVPAYKQCGQAVLVPVKSDRPIPKDKLADAMKIINSRKAILPVKVGDVIAFDFIEQGTNLVACKSVK